MIVSSCRRLDRSNVFVPRTAVYFPQIRFGFLLKRMLSVFFWVCKKQHQQFTSNFKICLSHSTKFGKQFAVILPGVTFKNLYISLRGLSHSADLVDNLVQRVYYAEFKEVLMPAVFICHSLFLTYWL